MANALKARWRRWFERKQRRAVVAVEQPVQLERTANQAEQKAFRSPTVGKLRQAWSDIQVLVRLTRAYARGDYRQVSKSTIILIAAALTYFVSPIDAIFDHLPLGGFLDDAAVLAWVVSEVRAEIEAFRLWEATTVNPALPSVPPTLPPTSSAA
jgi:uncharacterized membrane protein YkvA (DUF1232 family)